LIHVQVREFVDWLHEFNAERPAEKRVRFAGLDLYALYTSIAEVLRYLDDNDPATAAVARQRYGSLTPFQSDPAEYGKAVLTGQYRSCEKAVVAVLRDLLATRLQQAGHEASAPVRRHCTFSSSSIVTCASASKITVPCLFICPSLVLTRPEICLIGW